MAQSSPDDIITVQNIDIGCTDIITDVIPTNRKELDHEGKPYTLYEDVTVEMDHSEGFTVRYGQHPFTLKPGEVRQMPRYIAEHFANHLTSHLLAKKEAETGIQGLSKDKNEHKKLLKQIFLNIEHIYKAEELSPGEAAAAQVAALNENVGSLDRPVVLGKVDPIGIGTDDAPVKIEELLEQAEVEDKAAEAQQEPVTDTSDTTEEVGPKTVNDFTKKELLETAHNMTIPVTGKESKEELLAKIRSF